MSSLASGVLRLRESCQHMNVTQRANAHCDFRDRIHKCCTCLKGTNCKHFYSIYFDLEVLVLQLWQCPTTHLSTSALPCRSTAVHAE